MVATGVSRRTRFCFVASRAAPREDPDAPAGRDSHDAGQVVDDDAHQQRQTDRPGGVGSQGNPAEHDRDGNCDRQPGTGLPDRCAEACVDPPCAIRRECEGRASTRGRLRPPRVDHAEPVEVWAAVALDVEAPGEPSPGGGLGPPRGGVGGFRLLLRVLAGSFGGLLLSAVNVGHGVLHGGSPCIRARFGEHVSQLACRWGRQRLGWSSPVLPAVQVDCGADRGNYRPWPIERFTSSPKDETCARPRGRSSAWVSTFIAGEVISCDNLSRWWIILRRGPGATATGRPIPSTHSRPSTCCRF